MEPSALNAHPGTQRRRELTVKGLIVYFLRSLGGCICTVLVDLIDPVILDTKQFQALPDLMTSSISEAHFCQKGVRTSQNIRPATGVAATTALPASRERIGGFRIGESLPRDSETCQGGVPGGPLGRFRRLQGSQSRGFAADRGG